MSKQRDPWPTAEPGPAAQTPDAAATRTETAPAVPPPAPGPVPLAGLTPALAAGERFDDFEILRLLGSGAFARVYLARQISLDRLVALKISANQGSEARTLARLEHHHIVQVFSEGLLAEKNLRLLCMQFVPGVTLSRIIGALAARAPWTGQTFLEVLDELCTEATPLDLRGVEIRGFLEACDFAEVTCWLGARLAEALAHAHNQGVIHQDIKPANILVNRYGRPLLADFNIARSPSAQGIVGGTPAYMAPEQFDAFTPADAGSDGIGPGADLYSLSLVLFQLLTGKLPFKRDPPGTMSSESLRIMVAERRQGSPSPRAMCDRVPELLDRLLRRCLEPEPARRFPSAANFMHALDGCRDLLQVDKAAPKNGWLQGGCRARPFCALIVLALVPHLLGSAVNIAYNAVLIEKTSPQQAVFQSLVLGYNIVVYPCVVAVAVVVVRRVYHGWRDLRQKTDVPAGVAAADRQRALRLPGWVVLLSCLGWFPGGLIFPAGLHVLAGPLSPVNFVHFLISFVLSGLIALTYSYFGVQYVVLRHLYPNLWSDPSAARPIARQELQQVPGKLRFYQFLAVLIPLAGAALLIGVGPDQLSLGFRVLVTALLILGLAGFALATRVANRLNEVVSLLMGGGSGQATKNGS